MYGLLWHALPGPTWLRVLVILLLAAAAVLACFEWVFPWVSQYVPMNDNTVGASAP
jgi:hypothetical protein